MWSKYRVPRPRDWIRLALRLTLMATNLFERLLYLQLWVLLYSVPVATCLQPKGALLRTAKAGGRHSEVMAQFS